MIKVKIVGISELDAWYGERASLIGVIGTINDDTVSNDFVGGAFHADEEVVSPSGDHLGDYFYFYKAQYQEVVE